ncbi:lysis protein [Cronobacter sakazakii]|nr:lysis protein [Cronobacter sakazakii]MCI0214988.1 lysis protein [Cronobacter sakazakii]MCI0304923.1 lysis protein [Cronobacter sakazakii]PUV34890.1 lysis protein [Cronobacter sakazakii]RRA27314.1 lysis protein [Cronobacter sakazakii]RRA32260.1 lysis protein [Cronobacter sakazakii]
MTFIRAWWKPLLFIALLATAFYYRTALTKTEASLTEVNRELKLAKDDIADMQRRQRDVAALDAKYTQELNDAKSTINQLERDVAAGNKRLRLNATCGKNAATGATGVDDGTGPRLTDAAQRDYFTLRERIETVTKQLSGLQDYVREQCLK